MTTSPDAPSTTTPSTHGRPPAWVADYLDRVGLTAPPRHNLAGLQQLMTAQVATIPFETLDPWRGEGVHDLGVDALHRKLVRSRRGGFCYELNGLFGHVLEALGWSVRRVTGRVLLGGGDADAVPRTHQVTLVDGLPGGGAPVIADVGFGAHVPAAPLPLDDPGTVVATAHGQNRVDRDGRWVTVSGRRDGGDPWRSLYRLDVDEPQLPIDLSVGSWYASTGPVGTFAGTLVAGLVLPDTRWALGATSLTEYPVGAPARHRELADPTELGDVLGSIFGIPVDRVPGFAERARELFAAAD